MLRRLEMIVAIDQHRNFGRAARALGISQPSLTRALQVLEAELGVRLFERDRAECQPTEFGRIMLARPSPPPPAHRTSRRSCSRASA